MPPGRNPIKKLINCDLSCKLQDKRVGFLIRGLNPHKSPQFIIVLRIVCCALDYHCALKCVKVISFDQMLIAPLITVSYSIGL